MKNVYPVLFTKTADGILVEVPDFKIVTEGKDEFEAIKSFTRSIENSTKS